jgi:septum formation protein
MLDTLGIPYEAIPTDVEEAREGLPPEQLVVENAAHKALAGLALAEAGEGDVALGVDTEVFLEGRALGKAGNEGEARERLEALSGRTHEVLSGVALASGEGRREASDSRTERCVPPDPPSLKTGVARTLVTFRELDNATLSAYLASGEWRDRAGAYAIQGLGSILIERIEGDFSNVVGLPLQLLVELAPDLFPVISSVSAESAEKSGPQVHP